MAKVLKQPDQVLGDVLEAVRRLPPRDLEGLRHALDGELGQPRRTARKDSKASSEEIENFLAALNDCFGMWANREDIGDGEAYVRKLRRGTGKRMKQIGL